MNRKTATPTVENNAYSVLKLSVTRLMHVREVQATGGGHFAQVARELGYTSSPDVDVMDEVALELAEKEKAALDSTRRKRSDALVERLKRARERLGVNSQSQPPFGKE